MSTTLEILPGKKQPEPDLFILEGWMDIAIKDDLEKMVMPFYSLTANPVRTLRTIEYKENSFLELQPSVEGLPTIFDKDLILYAISQLCLYAQKNGDENIPNTINFNPISYIDFMGKKTGGATYLLLEKSLTRLSGSRFRTYKNLGNGKTEQEWYGLVDSAKLITTNTNEHSKSLIQLKLSDETIDAIRENKVLTLNKDYFKLNQPLARRLYEIARKFCGNQRQWTISLDKLHARSGSMSNLRKFRFNIKKLMETNHLPDYNIYYDNEKDQVKFSPKSSFTKAYNKNKTELRDLEHWIYEKANEILPNHFNAHVAEQSWRDYWQDKGKLPIENPEAAFLGYCKKLAVKLNDL